MISNTAVVVCTPCNEDTEENPAQKTDFIMVNMLLVSSFTITSASSYGLNFSGLLPLWKWWRSPFLSGIHCTQCRKITDRGLCSVIWAPYSAVLVFTPSSNSLDLIYNKGDNPTLLFQNWSSCHIVQTSFLKQHANY